MFDAQRNNGNVIRSKGECISFLLLFVNQFLLSLPGFYLLGDIADTRFISQPVSEGIGFSCEWTNFLMITKRNIT